ncbi:MAG TPA: hypothetical protein VLB67_15400 [Acidimicrobiia bacterium]|nr:hypothetical protein [Acidimicrobiia bacterium]
MTVSGITGARQRRMLMATTWFLAACAGLGIVIPGTAGSWLAGVAILVLIAAPLVRVAWVVARLAAEHDRRFALVGVALLGVVALGVVASLLLRG